MQTCGGNIRYATPAICLGWTALAYSFGNVSLEPEPKPYNLFYFRGKRSMNMSLDYLWRNQYLKIYGETAISGNRALAILNAVQFTPASYFTLLLLYRYYDKKYHAFFGDAFSQNTTVQNEQGVYLGLQLTPFAHWKVSTYSDFFRFPWLKYEADAPSSGVEYMLQVDYTQIENASFYARYRYKQKEKNATLPDNATAAIQPYEQHRLRLQAQYKIQAVALKTSADGIVFAQDGKASKGYSFAQSLGWKPEGLPFQADLSANYFHTADYNTRLSAYEKNILYAFYTPQLYGKGIRLSATLRWDLPQNLSLFGKLSYTRYTDRDLIGSGLEEIEGNVKSDISLLLRWKF
jgi:hypothetical protein